MQSLGRRSNTNLTIRSNSDEVLKTQAKRIEVYKHNVLKYKYAFPASIQKANIHKNSVKFGAYPKQGTNDVCSCCERGVKNQSLSTCTRTLPKNLDMDIEEEFKIMSGVAMFFLFVKMLILYMLLRCLFVDVFNLATNINEGIGKESKWIYLSIMNKRNDDEFVKINDILSFITVAFSVAYFLAFRKIQYLTYHKIDLSNQTADDYTIFVEEIPVLNMRNLYTNPDRINVNYEKQLQTIFKNKLTDWLRSPVSWSDLEQGTIQYDYHETLFENPAQCPNDMIKSISLCYNITELERIKDLRQETMEEHEKSFVEEGMFQTRDFTRQVQLLNNSEIYLAEDMAKQQQFIFKASHFVQSAFVTFKYQHYRNKILQLYEADHKAFSLNDTYLRVSEACHPSEVKWENLVVTSSSRQMRIIVSISILVMTLILSFGLILGLSLSTNLSQSFQGSYVWVNWTSIFLTLLLNFALKTIIYILVPWQRHITKTDEKYSLTVKLIFSQFINQGLIYLVVAFVRSTNPKSWLTSNGLVVQISNLLIVSGLTGIALNFINFSIIYRKLMLWYYYSDYVEGDQVQEYQINLNKKYQYPQFDVSERYSYYIVQLYTTVFYAHLVPAGCVALFVIFIFQYWVDKFNLFQRSSLFYEINFSLTRKILKFFESSILVYAVGNMFFAYQIQGSVSVLNIITLLFSICYVIFITFAPTKLQKTMFQPYEKLQKYDYNKIVKKGILTYWRLNPVTKYLPQKKVLTKKQKLNKKDGNVSYMRLKTEED